MRRVQGSMKWRPDNYDITCPECGTTTHYEQCSDPNCFGECIFCEEEVEYHDCECGVRVLHDDHLKSSLHEMKLCSQFLGKNLHLIPTDKVEMVKYIVKLIENL